MDLELIHLLTTQYSIVTSSCKKKIIIILVIESLKTELIWTDITLDLNQKAKFLFSCLRINWIHITCFDQIIFHSISSNSSLYPYTSFVHSTFQLLEEKSNHQSEQAANGTNYSNDSPDLSWSEDERLWLSFFPFSYSHTQRQAYFTLLSILNSLERNYGYHISSLNC